MNRFIFHVTRWIGIALIVMMALCSVALLMMDVKFGQDYVRGFFSDIIPGTDYRLPYQALFGINTTLTVAMLTGISLLFLFSASLGRHVNIRGSRMGFLWFQVFFFLYLACDERLLIHEKIGSLLSINDAIWILALGVVELLVLFSIGEVIRQPWRIKKWLLAAAASFSIMVCVDALFPADMRGRLALEDLSKTWAIVFLLIYAWQYCMDFILSSFRNLSNGAQVKTQ